MFVKFIGTDRTEVAVNSHQVSFISPVTQGTRIRFSEGRSVTVTEPVDEVMEALNRTTRAAHE